MALALETTAPETIALRTRQRRIPRQELPANVYAGEVPKDVLDGLVECGKLEAKGTGIEDEFAYGTDAIVWGNTRNKAYNEALQGILKQMQADPRIVAIARQRVIFVENREHRRYSPTDLSAEATMTFQAYEKAPSQPR